LKSSARYAAQTQRQVDQSIQIVRCNFVEMFWTIFEALGEA